MDIGKLIKEPEGRRIEFKEHLPVNSELIKTVIAFANDAGGELFIGVKDKPRKVTGIKEDELIKIEERISSLIHDNCHPVILPEILFLRYQEKYVMLIRIHKGSNPPYFIKSKGIRKGTYIRVGSSNRQANDEIISEMERQKSNISFDSLPVFSIKRSDIVIHSFEKHFEETTGEKLNDIVLRKLNLITEEQGEFFPVNSLILLSDNTERKKIFPYAKIECAVFKGTIPGQFIDQKTIDAPLSLQPELAYKFILRHISQGSEYEGIYRKDRWEYPVIAIREVIRNAVIHRDYSLNGKDIKIAIFDDKIEITSPGKLLPTVDFDEMETGQSDIRNKVLAPVFKKMGIIEQWGNGLRLIADELKSYPAIDFKWNEPGIAFRVSFIKKHYSEISELSERATDYDRLRPITTDYDQLSMEEEMLLNYLKKYGRITRKNATEIVDFKDTKIKALFKSLLDKRLIIRKGNGRSTYYILNKTK